MHATISSERPTAAPGSPAVRSEPLRVLVVIPRGRAPSSMIFAERQVEHLAQAGVVTEVFYLRSRINLGTLLSDRARFRRLIRLFRPHVIHAQYGTMTGFFCVLSTSLPVAITFRGSDLNPCPGNPFWRSALARLLSQFAAMGAAQVICVSEELRRRLWLRGAAAVVMSSGTDARQFAPQPQAEARLRLGWPPSPKIVVMNGRDPVTKGVALAKAAIDLAQKERPELTLLILDGSTDPAVMPTVLNASDCLLVTSQWEGSPTMVQEALACNLPLVSVDVGDVRQRIAGLDKCALVPRSPQAIARALVLITDSPDRSNGRSAIPACSLDHNTERLVEIYRTLSRKPGSAPANSACEVRQS